VLAEDGLNATLIMDVAPGAMDIGIDIPDMLKELPASVA
jgi:hypothetical protein